ncbi:MAG: exodeoxyribonuclease VII large subunit [Acidobacteria bacterium]|nr:exodeoxyribonuclease VII large subunit [Acidobacteriota bacterium]NIM62215.1 exodeoxyribonuclease VII large subunit [Acidobacteriota bacterium]NIO58997.1 exodeoxyribonuclease VII large subunit [Acidobacteriota bacterium]NIQ30043.1 exodeoxyribonuclease VII large subunit [Acidobacteriota bacterium]NIQ84809.1 exodeoxyribonuclease VII large subunit [Acidobacteriota bacterium]
MSRRVDHDGQTLLIRFPFDRALVERVKTLPGRRWNASERYWFVPDDHVVAVVDLLADDGFEFDESTRGLYTALGGSRALDERPASTGGPSLTELPLFAANERRGEPLATVDDTDLTVGRLNGRVRELLAGAFPAPVWLVGEISGFNKSAHRKHVGFELIERSEDGQAVSKVSAILFESTRREIERQLRDAGEPFQLEDEISVRFSVRVDLHVPWGQYRVVIERLDVHYTLGEAARRREEIVRRLTAAGLHEVNRLLQLPALPLRVGLITSLGSDAYNDVLRTLGESGFAFAVTVHGARVQGHSTEPSVLNALDWFGARADRFDALLICRGGGSRTDLVWFDTERLGRAVALFPLPVIIGIGHEQDQSVLDAVARSCKTPTAAAGFLVECANRALHRTEETAREILASAADSIAQRRRESEDRARRLAGTVRHRLELERSRLEQFRRQARSSVQAALQKARERVAVSTQRIPRESRRLLELGRERLTSRQRRLVLVDPRRVVERGYAIVRRADRSVLVDAARADSGETLIAELKHGRLRVTADKMVPDSNAD